MYTQFDIFGITIMAIITIVSYIYLVVTDTIWCSIHWKRLWHNIRKAVCRILLKLFRK